MMTLLTQLRAVSQEVYFANNNDALIPELWALESLLQLEKMSVFPHLVHRDFEDTLARFGQVVNAHRPQAHSMSRKGSGDPIVAKNAVTDTIPVVMNQHLYDSFLIEDGEESKSFADLVAYHLVPSMRAMAEGMDRILAQQVYHFLGSSVGALETIPTAGTLADAKALLTNSKVPAAGRNNVIAAETEAAFTKIDLFVGADRVGDEGSALREGSLGRKYGAENIVDIAIPVVTGGTAGLAKTVNFVAGYPKGYTGAIVLDTATAHAVYSVLTIGGAVYTVASATLTSVTLNEPLKAALADGDVISQQAAAAVTNAYAIGYLFPVVITGLRGAVGEAVRDAAGNVYSVIEVTGVDTYLLDKPLVAAFTPAQSLGVYPDGSYNFSFHRDALALIVRPLAAPREGTGALSAVVEHNGLGIRVVITYDGTLQGHLVTLDMLAGVTVLDPALGAVMLS